MFRNLLARIKEWIQYMIGPKNVENVLHVTPLISTKMANRIELWDDMYKDKAPWLKQATTADPVTVASLGLPSFIASEKARMAILEMKTNITYNAKKYGEIKAESNQIDEQVEKKEVGSEEGIKEITILDRVEYLNKVYQDKVIKKLRKNLEYAEAKGGMVIKPYVTFQKVTDDEAKVVKEVPQIEVEFIQADGFFPLAYDGGGKITEAAFVQTIVNKNIIYRRLEYHKLEGQVIHIINKAFKSTNTNTQIDKNNADLGQEIFLSEVPEWKDIEPEVTISNVDRLLFAYYRTPEANTVDTMSPLGMSCYGRATDLIKQADIQYSRLLWEYEATEAAIDIDREALRERKDEKGNSHTVPNMLQARLFRKLDLGNDDTYKPFLPAIRDASLLNGLNSLLQRIEDTCSLSRGTISDITSSEAKTATELKILKQRSFSANQDIQYALQETLEDIVYIFDVYCSLYNIVGDSNEDGTNENTGKYEVSFEWDDSILVDVTEELTKRVVLLNNGLISKVELRMWYFGETEEQAKEALKKVKEFDDEESEDDLNKIINKTPIEGANNKTPKTSEEEE